MAIEVAPPLPQDSTATGDEELPRTVPIRVLAEATTQPAAPPELEPTDVDTQNIRFVPHELPPPTEPNNNVSQRLQVQQTPTGGIPRRFERTAVARPPAACPRLRVLRGLKINSEYPLYDGTNFLGRSDEEPVDIDLTEQEPTDRIWASRRHAAIYVDGGTLQIEDLHSRNGTFLNRSRLAPGDKRLLQVNDVIQIGTIQMRVTV